MGDRCSRLACGQGLDAERIVQRCGEYTGIDVSAASVEVARREVEACKPDKTPVSFRVADAERLPFEDMEFDIVYSIGVLHHTPDFDAALLEAHRVLKPGGTLVLMLYRSFTPLWIVLRGVRGLLKLPGVGRWLRQSVVDRERRRLSDEDHVAGTAILELFGCPIIDTYTLRDLRRRFRGCFTLKQHQFHRVGIEQIIRVLPAALRERWPQGATERIEHALRRSFGFYMVLVAERS